MLVTTRRRVLAIVGTSLLVLTTCLVFLDRIRIPQVLKSEGKWFRFPIDHSTAGESTNVSETHIELFSASNKDGKYFIIDFGEEKALNPSVIPHPFLSNTWIVTAQTAKHSSDNSIWFTELVCEAQFKDNHHLSCIKPAKILPIAATGGDKCVDDVAYFNLNIGPHDARTFYGPQNPYTVFGSNSGYTCFGQWIQDLRVLVDWGSLAMSDLNFKSAIELQRPVPFNVIEKNYFLFWDKDGTAFVHYDIAPFRAFSQLQLDGSAGSNLALLAQESDQKCMEAYMPGVAPELESIHQATNSLSITLCSRSDISCEPDDSNTFILTIIQHKSFYSYHSVYEPYPVLFRRTAPFELFAISKKPLWYHGRGKAGEAMPPGLDVSHNEQHWNQTQMIYTTSISWKSHGQKYHGYLDDIVIIGFGIEDEDTGGIDVPAGALLAEYGLCSLL